LDDADVVPILDENVVNALPAGTICPGAVNQLLSCSREPSADLSTFISEGSVPFPPARLSLLCLYILSGQGQLHAYQDFESDPGLYADFKAKPRFVCP
jgi:hypothetical protein